MHCTFSDKLALQTSITIFSIFLFIEIRASLCSFIVKARILNTVVWAFTTTAICFNASANSLPVLLPLGSSPQAYFILCSIILWQIDAYCSKLTTSGILTPSGHMLTLITRYHLSDKLMVTFWSMFLDSW